MILSHRGDTELYAPNTRESVVSALNKCDGVELDLNMSSDSMFYFYHEGDWTDQIIARRYRREAISQIVPNGESVLDLGEALQLAKRVNKHLVIHAEIGGGGPVWALDFTTGEVEVMLGIIEKSGIDKELVLFHTVNPGKAKELDGHTVFHRQPLVLRRQYGMYRFGALMAVLPYIDVSTTMAYVINDERELNTLLLWGIGYILTDRLFDGAR